MKSRRGLPPTYFDVGAKPGIPRPKGSGATCFGGVTDKVRGAEKKRVAPLPEGEWMPRFV